MRPGSRSINRFCPENNRTELISNKLLSQSLQFFKNIQSTWAPSTLMQREIQDLKVSQKAVQAAWIPSVVSKCLSSAVSGVETKISPGGHILVVGLLQKHWDAASLVRQLFSGKAVCAGALSSWCNFQSAAMSCQTYSTTDFVKFNIWAIKRIGTQSMVWVQNIAHTSHIVGVYKVEGLPARSSLATSSTLQEGLVPLKHTTSC